MCGNICSPIEAWWYPRSGRFILPCQHNWGPIFLFSEVEVGGSALFANVIPNRSYTNAIRAVFGSVVHKIDWQLESSISEMHSAILWAIAFFRGEVCLLQRWRLILTAAVIMLKNNLQAPRSIRFTESVGPNQISNFCSTPTESSHPKSTNRKENIKIWWILGVCTVCKNIHILRGIYRHIDIM